MSSRITNSLLFLVALIFISLTSYTNVSSKYLYNVGFSENVPVENNTLITHFIMPIDVPDQAMKSGQLNEAGLTPAIKKTTISVFNSSHIQSVNSKPIDNDWLHTLQHNLALAEYHPGSNAQGLQAPNRAHNLRTYFEPTGISVHDRTAKGDPVLTALSLNKMGRATKLENIPPGFISQNGRRIEIHRPGVIEWYVNSAKGLEQGFTVSKKIVGQGDLVLELTVNQAKATLQGQSIDLLTDTGRSLNYGKFFVEDALGNKLPAHMEVPAPHLIRLVMNDTQASYPLLIDPLITAVADSILESNQADPAGFKSAVFGSNVASAGDVNGDGFDDVIVGAPGWDGGDPHEGAAFVFLGSALGIVGNSPSNAHARIESNQFGAQLGTLPATVVGDVNGDGYDDIVVGAHNYDDILPGTTLAVDGAAFVFHGGPSGITGSDPTTANAHIHPNELGSDLGLYVSGAGDVNGDGFADILVGVPNHGTLFPSGIPVNDRSGNYGAALVFHGSLNNGITGTGFNDADAVILPYIDTGTPLPEALGQIGSVSGIGDINADGFDDIVLGGNEIRLFFGSGTGILASDITMAQQSILADPVLGISQSIGGSGTGFLVEGVGDINGDNIPDAIASIPFRPLLPNLGPTSEGAVYVFLGTTTGLAASSGTVSSAHAAFFGNQVAENLGLTISGVGDVNGDNLNDIAFSARTFPGSLNAEGVAYVFHGSLTGFSGTTLADAAVRLESGQSGAATVANGTAVAVAGTGDINGDGFNDVIVGFPYYDAGQENEGVAFIYHGEPSPITPNQPPMAVAGDDQALIDVNSSGAATVTLDGSLSTDPDGVIVSYQWREGETVLGTSPVLTTALSVNAIHKLVLIVTDDAGLSRGDPVTVQVNSVSTTLVGFDDFSSGGFAGGIRWSGSWIISGNVSLAAENLPFPAPTPPQALIGAGATMSRSTTLPAGTTGMKLKYHAKASQFSPTDQIAVQVNRDGGPFITIKIFTAADSDDSYRYYDGTIANLSWYPATASNLSIRYVSTATTGQLFIDNVEVQAIQVPAGTPIPPAGELPIAHAGNDITVTDSDGNGLESVVLDGALSTDTDGSIVSFEWFHETPLNGPQLLGTGASLLTSFDVGIHTVRLLVTDNTGASSADTVVITVNAGTTTNLPPIANAGPDQTIIDVDGNTLEVVTFDGQASSDPDGTIVSYVWRKNGNPYNNAATFSITESIGVHTVELTVTDDQGATSTDTVVITIVANTPPPPPSIVSLSAAPGSISGEFILSWSTTDATSASIDNGVGAVAVNGSATVNPAVTTAYTLTATGAGGTVTSNVTVTVNTAPPPTTTTTFSGFLDKGGTSSHSLTIDVSGPVAVNLTWNDNRVDPLLMVFDPNNNVVASQGGTQPIQAGFTAAIPGVYVFQIQNLNNKEKSDYVLQVTHPIGAPPTLTSIIVTPASATIEEGQSQLFTATGSFSDGSTADLTSTVNWSSSSVSIATINVSGLASGILAGTTSISASQGGMTRVATLMVTPPPPPPTLTSISVTPAIVSIEEGQSQSFIATGSFSDGSTADLTSSVTWSSSSVSIATINVSGLANGILAGTTSISASQGGMISVVTLTVTIPPPPAALTSISVTPAIASIEEGQSQSFTATGSFSDGSTADLTSSVTWSSSTTSVATINASGLATGILQGTTSISATQNAVTSNIASLTVTAPPPPAQGSIVISGPTTAKRGDSLSFSVTLTNTGSTILNGVQLTFSVNPSKNIKNLSPGSSQTIGQVLPGASVTRIWSGKADKEGTVIATTELLTGGTSLATATQSLTIIK